MQKYNTTNGVWRTVGGRRIFIKNGYDLPTAMKESGKFENTKDKVYYHTSNHKFTMFDNTMPRKALLGGQWGYGHYFFDNKELSDGYGAYSRYQYEVKLNVKKWFKAKDKDFIPQIRNMGYNSYNDDIANFLQAKGYEGSIIEHPKLDGSKWYEYVVYDSKNIKIIKRKEIK